MGERTENVHQIALKTQPFFNRLSLSMVNGQLPGTLTQTKTKKAGNAGEVES